MKVYSKNILYLNFFRDKTWSTATPLYTKLNSSKQDLAATTASFIFLSGLAPQTYIKKKIHIREFI
jgi:hypothetical protein